MNLDQFILTAAANAVAGDGATPEDVANAAELLCDQSQPAGRDPCVRCGRMTIFGCSSCKEPLCGRIDCTGDCPCGAGSG